jgi:hypothetical protein
MPYVLQELCHIAKAWIYSLRRCGLGGFAPMRILWMVRMHWFGEIGFLNGQNSLFDNRKPSEETLRLLQTTTKFFYQPSPAVFSAKLPHR